MQRFFFFCFLLSLSGNAAAQIPAETILETAVRNYNNLREMTGNLKPETITETDLRTIPNPSR